jgi:glycosyltransferase involved in cell wall biosynthesis
MPNPPSREIVYLCPYLELAGAILRLFKDPGLRVRLAAAGRARVLEIFDESFAAKTTVDYYDPCWEIGVPG